MPSEAAAPNCAGLTTLSDDSSPAPLRVGLAGWRGLVAADTPEGRARVATLFADWTPSPGAPTEPDDARDLLFSPTADDAQAPFPSLTTLCIDLTHGPLPRLRLVREGRPVDFSPFLTGPGGKRFVAVPHPTRLLFRDQAVGEDEPIVELLGGEVHILRPDLWPFYAVHALTWRMLCEAPIAALHAAVCAVEGVALVVAGPSGCGKSTLCWALARLGADYFTDECAFFDLEDHRLHVLPGRAGLRPGGVALLESPPEGVVWSEAKPGDPKFSPDMPAPKVPVHGNTFCCLPTGSPPNPA